MKVILLSWANMVVNLVLLLEGKETLVSGYLVSKSVQEIKMLRYLFEGRRKELMAHFS